MGLERIWTMGALMKVGDQVIVKQNAKELLMKHTPYLGWNDVRMDRRLGQQGKIIRIDKNFLNRKNVYYVAFGKHDVWCFPKQCLMEVAK